MSCPHKNLPPIPDRIARLRVDARGYPVPWFVAWIGGMPDFRIVDAECISIAIKDRVCWVCGEALGANMSFTIGPMCSINRISSEPPSHLECAEFSVRACPFLTRPSAHRRETNMPEGHTLPAGEMIRRNPGVTLIWTTKRYKLVRTEPGVLFEVGDPTRVDWYREGRLATRAEILESIDSGIHLLRSAADAEGAGPELDAAIARAMKHVPTEGGR